MPEIIEIQDIKQSYTYDEYKTIVFDFAEQNSTSGEQTEERIAATLINAQRIKRIDKQCEINEDLKLTVSSITKKQFWTVITESWCGDGAQNIPAIAKIAACNSNIELKFIFRDESIPLIDSFLTNGSRAVPKLICVSENEVIGTWGPRPIAIQNMVVDFKKNNPEISHEEFVKNLHLWYARDKTNSLQKEFVTLLNSWAKK